MTQEDAFQILLQWLRNPPRTSWPTYGYDLYIPAVIRRHLERTGTRAGGEAIHVALRDWTPVFADAAWEMARRGIVRPGVRGANMQATDDGSAGFGFSVTPFGRQWVAETGHETFVPTEPGRFAELLQPYRARFGPGFYERSQEAIRCYGAHAYLACCAMCGAAAESILLAAAIAKDGDQEAVLREYQTANGRGRVQTRLVGQASAPLKKEFAAFMTLLKYWRDIAAHGTASDIAENEAFTSLALLLRLAIFANDNWDTLVRSGV